MRKFETGATRDTDEGKADYPGFESSLVRKRFGEYMLLHQTQADGSKRHSDNWKAGIPIQAYVSSLSRHVLDVLLAMEGYPLEARASLEDALCAVLFNANGMLHEIIKRRLENQAKLRPDK